jgi:hypothetical protein
MSLARAAQSNINTVKLQCAFPTPSVAATKARVHRWCAQHKGLGLRSKWQGCTVILDHTTLQAWRIRNRKISCEMDV